MAAQEADSLTLGSGAIAGTSYGIDTDLLARTPGLLASCRTAWMPRPIAISSPRSCMQFRWAWCISAGWPRISSSLQVKNSFFDLADASATGSSMMPQKKNPDPLELVRGKTGRAIGRLTGWLATMKGLPGGYNKDLQEDKEAVFDAEATLCRVLAATHAVVSCLSVNAERSGQAASGLLLATDVADYLVARDAVPARPRGRWGDGQAAARRRPRLQHIEHGRMARGK